MLPDRDHNISQTPLTRDETPVRQPRLGRRQSRPDKLSAVRNNAAQPTIGHVIMFAAAAAGWLILFLINLTLFTPSAGWWIRAVFSGVLLVASLVFAVVLWRRVNRNKAADRA